MADFSNAQVGFAAEVAYGTPLPPTRGISVDPDAMSMLPVYQDVMSNSVKTGFRVRPSRRSSRYLVGATGNLRFDVEDKGFGYWMQQMLGGTITTTDMTTHKQ